MRTPAARRADDGEDDDHTDQRRPITGDEVRVGVGNKALTLRGSMVICVVIGIALLGLVAYGIREQDRAQQAITLMMANGAREHERSQQALSLMMANEHRRMTDTIDRTLRVQTCVLSMTPQERLQWRGSRDAPNALIMFCPGMLAGFP